MTFNAPRPQSGPLAWGLFCLFGFLLAIYMLFDYPVGGESWWVGVLLAVMVLLGFLAIEGWWFLSQREVTLGERNVVIRRWSDALIGRPGVRTTIDAVRSLQLVYDSGKRIRFDTRDGALSFWAALWPQSEVHRLLIEAESRGITVQADW